MSASRSRLEVQLQRQLHQAREVVLAIGEHTENRTGKRGALRSAANRGIGQVEGFGLELETVAFAELGFLGDGRVQLRQGGVLDVAREALRQVAGDGVAGEVGVANRKSTRLNSSHLGISD